MSIQIAMRLPPDVVEYLDRAVAEGRTRSRAALVSAALVRQMRFDTAVADATLLREHGPEDDLDDLVDWTTSHASIPE